MLNKLLALQSTDLEIDKLAKQNKILPERQKKADLLAELERQESKKKQFEQKLKVSQLEQDKAEGEVKMLETKISKETERLYSGKVTNPKELSSIQQEIQALSTKKEDLETKLLAVMEEVSDEEKMKAHFDSKIVTLSKEIAILENSIKNKSERINKELSTLKIQRNNQAATVDKDLIKEYENIRSRHQGIGIVKLVDGVCQACFVELPAVEIDKMRPSKKNYCPFCGRLIKY